jgi:glyceraldehyde 3-phosphate dehydrogenase
MTVPFAINGLGRVGRALWRVAHRRSDLDLRLVISANAPRADVTLCRGINDGDYDPSRHRLVSNASCTTHCVAPLARVLHQHFGVRRAVMTTVHSYTGNRTCR